MNITGTPRVVISGANAADFTVTTQPAASVAASGTSNFIVEFNPSGAGVRSATISIANDDANENPYDFAIQGTGIDPEVNLQGNTVSIADGDVTPSLTDHTDFGSQSVCSGTIVRTFTIQNTGNSVLNITGSNITGTNASDFSITASPSSTVAAAGSTTISVTFNPSAAGTRSATLNISTNDCDEATYDFAIQGSGTDPEVNVQGNSLNIVDGDVTPTSTDHTDFGSQSICSGTIVRTYTIQNTGNSVLNITGSSISGTNASDFSITASPSTTVAAAGSTTITVTFNPSASGTRSATLSINTNDCDEATYDFAIQGSGTDPEVNVQGNSLNIVDGDVTPTSTDHTDFGNQSICSGTIARTYTIQNTGNSVLNITGHNITGTNAADFSITANPSTTVAGAGSTTITVTFNPSASGLRTATLNISTNDCDESTYDFAIQGTGVDPEINVLGNGQSIVDGDITPSFSDSTDFGVSTGGKTRSYTIENTGNAALNISSIQVTGTNASEFSITNAPTSIGAGNNAKFYVTFNPNAANGTRNATITVNNNDCNESAYNYDIKAIAGFCDFSSFSASICSNQAYFFNGANRTTSGSYNDTLVNAAGCDSLVTLNLTVKSVSSSSFNVSICSNQSYFFNGANRTTTGSYKDTLTNAAGCDSVVTLNLSVDPFTSGSFNASICSNQSYFFNGVDRTTTGSYKDTLVNAAGCDSILTLNLTVNSTTSSSFSASICSNQSYLWNGVNLNTTGSYLDTFNNAAGCDSVVTLNLTVTNTLTPSISISVPFTTIIVGTNITFTATPSNQGSSPSYQWKKNSTNVGTGGLTYTTNTIVTGDTISCVLTGANNTCQTNSTATSNKIVMVANAILPDTLPFRINSTLLDSFNSSVMNTSGLAGCNGGNADDDKFFVVTKPNAVTSMNVTVKGSSNYNVKFEVFSGTSILNYTSMGCVNSINTNSFETESRLFTGLPSAATTYAIRVFDNRPGFGSGAFEIGVNYNNSSTINSNPCTPVNGSNSTARLGTTNGSVYLTAYDLGVGGGVVENPLNNPPFGQNIVYWEGTTAFAPFTAGAPLPTCGTPGTTPRRVWYTFDAPGLSDVGVTFRTTYNTTSNPTIMEVYSVSGSPCPTTFNSIKCSNTGTLALTPADLAPYRGQKLYVQLTEDGGLDKGLTYLLSIQGSAPAVTAIDTTTNGFKVVFPTGLTNISKYRVFWRLQGTTGGASQAYVPNTSTFYELTNLVSDETYEVWVEYFNTIISTQRFLSPTMIVKTLPGCSGTLPAPTAVIAPSPNTSCTKLVVSWPSAPMAGTANRYRLYWRVAGSSTYTNFRVLDDTFYLITGLSLNTDYEFLYKAVCPTGFALSGVTATHTTCGTPKQGEYSPIINSQFTHKGITYTNIDFRDLVMLGQEYETDVNGVEQVIDLADKVEVKGPINIYPNPTADYVNVEYETTPSSISTISILSTDGKKNDTREVDSHNGVLNPLTNKVKVSVRMEVKDLANGIYFVKIVNDGFIEVRQLIIEK